MVTHAVNLTVLVYSSDINVEMTDNTIHCRDDPQFSYQFDRFDAVHCLQAWSGISLECSTSIFIILGTEDLYSNTHSTAIISHQ